MSIEKIFITETDLAKRWGRSVSSLQNDRVLGKGVTFVKLGGSVRYAVEDIERFEQQARRTSTSNRGGENV